MSREKLTKIQTKIVNFKRQNVMLTYMEVKFRVLYLISKFGTNYYYDSTICPISPNFYLSLSISLSPRPVFLLCLLFLAPPIWDFNFLSTLYKQINELKKKIKIQKINIKKKLIIKEKKSPSPFDHHISSLILIYIARPFNIYKKKFPVADDISSPFSSSSKILFLSHPNDINTNCSYFQK